MLFCDNLSWIFEAYSKEIGEIASKWILFAVRWYLK